MNFLQPQDLHDLAQALEQKTPNSKFVAGATDYIPKQTENPDKPDILISLDAIPELKCIRKHCCSLTIGVMCTHTQTAEYPLVQYHFPSLQQACAAVGSQQIRNRGTIGGSVCNASAASDIYPVLLSVDARAVVMNAQRQMNKIHVADILTPDGKLQLAKDEVITDFALPVPLMLQESYCAFAKLGERSTVTISKLNLAVYVKLDDDDISHARVVLGGIAPRAIRCEAAETYLLGKTPQAVCAGELTQILSQEIQQRCAGRDSMPYKAEAVRGLVDEVLEKMGWAESATPAR